MKFEDWKLKIEHRFQAEAIEARRQSEGVARDHREEDLRRNQAEAVETRRQSEGVAQDHREEESPHVGGDGVTPLL